MTEIWLAITVFASTNVDDIFVLLSFFSDRRYRASEIIVGQYLGIACLVFVSIGFAIAAKTIPAQYVGLLGFIPLALGFKKLWALRKPSNENIAQTAPRASKIFQVAGVTVANGGDNLGVYIPFFTTKSISILILNIVVFTLMTGIWCLSAFYLLKHQMIGSMIERFARYFVPWIFIGLGAYILYEAKSFQLIGLIF